MDYFYGLFVCFVLSFVFFISLCQYELSLKMKNVLFFCPMEKSHDITDRISFLYKLSLEESMNYYDLIKVYSVRAAVLPWAFKSVSLFPFKATQYHLNSI